MITRIVTTLLCFVAAIACYVCGAPAGGMLFLLLGAVFEAGFWFGIFGVRKKKLQRLKKVQSTLHI